MARDDVYGEEENSFLQEEETWDEEDLGLDWDEAEFRRLASQLRTERGATPL